MSANSGGSFLFLEVASSIRSPKAVLLLASTTESEMNLSTEVELELFWIGHVLFADVEIRYREQPWCSYNSKHMSSLADAARWSKESAELLPLTHSHTVKNGPMYG